MELVNPEIVSAEDSSQAQPQTKLADGKPTKEYQYDEKGQLIRRNPLKTAKDVYENHEALGRVKHALLLCPPGSVNRWPRLVNEANVVIPPTEEELDPLRVELNMAELRKILSWLYRDTNTTGSEAFALMRKNMPILYEGHSPDTVKKASQKDRDANSLSDECFAYGELDYETFATIFMKTCAGYGTCLGDFVDLGSGVGTLVYAAAFLGNFTRCVGIERVKSVLDRGKKRMPRWDLAKEHFPVHTRSVEFDWLNNNFLEQQGEDAATTAGSSSSTVLTWTKYANFVFLHWTALSNLQIRQASELLALCQRGTMCITLTTPIDVSTGYEVLEQGKCDTSWGQATFYIHEKMI